MIIWLQLFYSILLYANGGKHVYSIPPVCLTKRDFSFFACGKGSLALAINLLWETLVTMSSWRWKKNKLLGSFLKAKTNSITGEKRTRPSRVPFSVVDLHLQALQFLEYKTMTTWMWRMQVTFTRRMMLMLLVPLLSLLVLVSNGLTLYGTESSEKHGIEFVLVYCSASLHL